MTPGQHQWIVTIAVEVTLDAPTYTEIPVIARTRRDAGLAAVRIALTRYPNATADLIEVRKAPE